MRSETHLKSIAICAAMVLFGTGYARAGTWTTLDFPGATTDTIVLGIEGSNLVGSYYYDGLHSHGFLYDGKTWTSLSMPGWDWTHIFDIDGSNLVGWYTGYKDGLNHGFLYDGTSWTTIDKPGAIHTHINGIDGSNLVGGYIHASNWDGFLYNGTT